MKKIIAFFTNIRLVKILTVFLAGILLLVSTACNNDSSLQAKAPDYHSPDLYQPKVYDRNPKNSQGGMNNFSDVDPRTDTRDIDIKAKQLTKNAERNVIDMTDDLSTNTQRTLDKKGENLEQFGKDIKQGTRQVGENIKENVRDIGEGTKRGISNLKENARTAPEDLKNRGIESRS
jgi:gas vesicle protein